MKNPDEYAWELLHGLERGDAHKNYIEEAGNRFQDDRECVINDDGLRYIEKFVRKIMFDTCDYTVKKTVSILNERTTENR